jgi:hypothetical protein
MYRVIQSYSSRIACRCAGGGKQCSEFGMAALETANVSRARKKRGVAEGCPQVSVTFSTSLIARGGDIDATAMLGVAFCAGELFRCACVMHRSIVTVEAGTVSGFGGKSSGLLHVAGRAFFFKDSVGS